jgi:hypothetical protein
MSQSSSSTPERSRFSSSDMIVWNYSLVVQASRPTNIIYISTTEASSPRRVYSIVADAHRLRGKSVLHGYIENGLSVANKSYLWAAPCTCTFRSSISRGLAIAMHLRICIREWSTKLREGCLVRLDKGQRKVQAMSPWKSWKFPYDTIRRTWSNQKLPRKFPLLLRSYCMPFARCVFYRYWAGWLFSPPWSQRRLFLVSLTCVGTFSRWLNSSTAEITKPEECERVLHHSIRPTFYSVEIASNRGRRHQQRNRPWEKRWKLLVLSGYDYHAKTVYFK